MKSRGFTIIELLIVVAILGILLAIAVPNFLMFQCRAEGRELGFDPDMTAEVCGNCIGCENISPSEALQMIKDGADPSRFVEVLEETQSTEEKVKIEFRGFTEEEKREQNRSLKEQYEKMYPSKENTNKLPEPIRRSWKD
jgi:prepilin-type N-terminal cleavage/methylation domain-containing protein